MGVYDADGLYHERQFIFYFATCLIVALLVTGSAGERARLEPLLGYCIFLSIFFYPVVLSWTWNMQGGFLWNLGYYDRGGSVVIF